ncbi:glutamate-rich protein 3 isoform X2 [Notamacropus eugenii]
MRKDHHKLTREHLTHAIYKKILEMEHDYQMELKRRLETTAKKERVQRVKVGRSRRIEHYMPVLSPHPPVTSKASHGSCVMIDQVYSSSVKLALSRPHTTPGRPSTAPANMQQRPSRLQPILNHQAAGATIKSTSMSKSKPSQAEIEGRFPSGGERQKNLSEISHGVAPYQLPIINEYLMPVPPPPSPRNEKMVNRRRIEAWRRRVRPTTAPNIPDPHRDPGRYHKSSLHSNAFITMIYWGKSVHLNHDDADYRDEIKIYQQHCGGENLCVFQGKLLEKETFQFISRRHYGFPFSLTFFLNGMQLDRLSSCCEFKHRRGARLGGKNGYFGFVNIEGASPCYKCIISMGLDKKPFPPPKKEKEMTEVNEGPVQEEEATKPRENFHKDAENVGPMPTEDDKKDEESVEQEVGGEEETEQDPADNDREPSFKDEYDEDFEIDDEKSNEKGNEDGQSDDQMNGRSKSPSDDEKDNLDREKESEASFQEIRDTSDCMKYEIDGCSDNDLENDQQDLKSIQEEIRESVEENERYPSETEPSDSSAGQAQEGRSCHLDHLPKDGDLLAEETMVLELEDEGSKHDAPAGEQLKRTKAFEGELVPESKKAGLEVEAEESRSRKEEEEEEEEEGEEEGRGEEEKGEEVEEKEAEATLGRGWVVVSATSAPRALVAEVKLTEVREVPGTPRDGEEIGAKGEGLASKEEGEAAERTRTAVVMTDARSEEETWRERDSERKEAVIQEEEAIGKAARDGQEGTGEIRHHSKSEARLGDRVIQNETGKSREEETVDEAEEEERTEAVSPAREGMTAWREVSDMEDHKGMYPEEQKGGQKAADLRVVAQEEEGTTGAADLEDAGGEAGYSRAAGEEEIVTEEDTEALTETARETKSQREVMKPLAVAKVKEVFEQLEKTTNGGEETEEKECDTKEGVGQALEPVERVVFHRKSAENERKLSLEESASEVKELSEKEGILEMEKELERDDGETRDGVTREVTCRAKEENHVETYEMELPGEVGRSANNREREPDITLARKERIPEEEIATKGPLVMERSETLGEIREMRAKAREEMGMLVKTHGAVVEEDPVMGGLFAPAPRTGTEMSHVKEAPKDKIHDLEGQAEAGMGDAGRMAATALSGEVLADEVASEGKTEENKTSSSSDVAVGETWPRQEHLLQKTADAGSGTLEEEARGELIPAVEEGAGKTGPEADPATEEGVLETRLIVQASGWDRDQRGDIVREDCMREKDQAGEVEDEEESRPGSPAPRGEVQPREGVPQSQSRRALETMAVAKETTTIRDKQDSTAQRKGDASGTEAPGP